MPLDTDTNHLEMDNGGIITGCTEFRTWDLYLSRMEKTLNIYIPRGIASTKNNRCIILGMVVK
jgi:hypothetical protein